jgi:tRNA A-37 threonylcarbamoyl transferase component Bud32
MGILALNLRPGEPDFIDLPWHLPLAAWEGATDRLVEMERGLSRHEVVFVEVGASTYALKELPPALAEKEYQLLVGMEERRLPAVIAAGHAHVRVLAEGEPVENGILITRYLEGSLPYRTLFQNQGLERYRERLLDAMASLLVRLHLAGFYWGDCSLSNTLFRRDAGELAAYAVDAETSAQYDELSDGQRSLDLDILEENVAGDLADLQAMVVQLPPSLPVEETGAKIREKVERLWSEIQREVVIGPSETYCIQERIRALNDLGFSVGELELVPTGDGDRLRLRTIVVDRDYHRRLLHGLTGLVAGDRQAELMVNEIKQLQATLAKEQNRTVGLAAAAHRWLDKLYRPTTERLREAIGAAEPDSELYCQLLEHKWYLSERAKRDVGHEAALADFLASNSSSRPA